MNYRPLFGLPKGENFQDNVFKGMHTPNGWNGQPFSPNPLNPSSPIYYRDIGHRRSAPAEPPFVEFNAMHRGWYQGPFKMPRSFQSNKYWARPIDGKRRGAMGRLLDGLTREGPDVFVVINGDRRTLSRDMPHKPQWSQWEGPAWDANWNKRMWDKDFTEGEDLHMTRPGVERNEHYNFRTRKYEGHADLMKHSWQGRLWTDAHWAPGAKRSARNPLSFRTDPLRYSTKVAPFSGFHPGGRPRR